MAPVSVKPDFSGGFVPRNERCLTLCPELPPVKPFVSGSSFEISPSQTVKGPEGLWRT